ncbi:MAG TPA: hypothetical protein VF701_08570 [Thermoanaerobaculia bacterium]
MPDAEKVLTLVVDDALFLRFAWDNHRLLFGDSEDVAVLNAAAGSYFRWTQILLEADVLMRISRLTDPAENRHQRNLTLQGLLRATGWKMSDPVKWTRFQDHLRDVMAACEGCRQHRNKRLSHHDLEIATKQQTLPSVTIDEIDQAVAAIERFIRDMVSQLRPGNAQSFQLVRGDKYVAELLEYLRNRPSRDMPSVVSTVRVLGDDLAELTCGYCGKSEESYFGGAKDLDGAHLRRWHFARCSFVVGHETISVHVLNSECSGARVSVALAKR